MYAPNQCITFSVTTCWLYYCWRVISGREHLNLSYTCIYEVIHDSNFDQMQPKTLLSPLFQLYHLLTMT